MGSQNCSVIPERAKLPPLKHGAAPNTALRASATARNPVVSALEVDSFLLFPDPLQVDEP